MVVEWDGNVAESCSNNGGDDHAAADDGKRKVGCGDEAENDDSDGNDNADVGDNGDVAINDENDANVCDGMSKTDRDDDADGGGNNCNNDSGVVGNGVFDIWGG